MGKPGLSKSNGVDPSLLKVPQFCCDFEGCRKYFSKLSKLKYHQNIHLAEKPYKCEYEGCTSAYSRPNHLKRHVESIHESRPATPKEHRCEHEGCGAAFDSGSSLYYHQKRKHSVQLLQCSFCDKKFSKKWMFKEHEASHTGFKPFMCDAESCNEEFKDYKQFRAHKRGHKKKADLNKKSLVCSVGGCNQSFTKWSELVSHKKLCHAFAETNCSICNKTFTKGNLKVHMQVHEEDRSAFQCPFDGCPRFYLHTKNLNHHMRIKHHGEGFECPLCKRKLSSKQKLEQHMQIIHDGKKTHKKKRKKVKKSGEEILNKLERGSELDWKIKKSGPHKRIRNTKGVNFPVAENIGKPVAESQQPVEFIVTSTAMGTSIPEAR